MSKAEIIEQIKKSAKELKKEYAEDLEYNRERGNYKVEITPGNIQDAYMKGAEAALDLAYKKGYADGEKNPSVETMLKLFLEFDKHGLIRDDLCFDPEHFMETVIKFHWNDVEE